MSSGLLVILIFAAAVFIIAAAVLVLLVLAIGWVWEQIIIWAVTKAIREGRWPPR